MINIRVPATKKTQKSREENTEKGPLGQLMQSIWRMRGEKMAFLYQEIMSDLLQSDFNRVMR